MEVLLDLLLGLAVVNLLVPVLTAVVVVHVVSLEHAVKAVRQLGDDKVGVEEPAGTRGLHRRVKLIQLPVVETRLESDAVPAAEDAAVRGVDVNLGGLPGDELLGDGEVEVSARRVGDVVNRGFGNLDLDVGQELLLLPLRLLSLRDGPRLSLSLHARSLGRLPLLRLVRQSVELSLLRELEFLLLRGDGGGDFLLGHLRGDGHLLGGHAGRGRGDPGDARGGTVGVPGSPVHRSGGVAVRGAVHARGGRNGRAVGGRRRGGHHGRRGSVDRRGQAVGGPLGRGRRRRRLGRRRGRGSRRLGRRGRGGSRRLGRRRGRRLRRRRRGRRGGGCRVESRVRVGHVERRVGIDGRGFRRGRRRGRCRGLFRTSSGLLFRRGRGRRRRRGRGGGRGRGFRRGRGERHRGRRWYPAPLDERGRLRGLRYRRRDGRGRSALGERGGARGGLRRGLRLGLLLAREPRGLAVGVHHHRTTRGSAGMRRVGETGRGAVSFEAAGSVGFDARKLARANYQIPYPTFGRVSGGRGSAMRGRSGNGAME